MDTKPVVGVICEYDPFHLGHARQLALIRRRLPDARIVCVMSGCFTQRGMPALHPPAERARAALLGGAGLVLELPCAFAVRDAENFALGGVSLLNRLGFVEYLCFGAEDGLDALEPAARLMEEPTPAYTAALKAALDRGESFAAAQGKALDECLGVPSKRESAPWEKPNNILAICYLRALMRLQSPLRPFAVRREGDYHESELKAGGYPSATAVRRAFIGGDYAAADAACPAPLSRAPVCRPDALDSVLLYKLRSMEPDDMRLLPDCSEGLENRLRTCALKATSREELLSLLKTRRYARARLSRLCCHALLDVTGDLLREHPQPEYARVLGLRRDERELRARLKHSAVPIVAKAADADAFSPLWRLDQRAYDLWALGAGLPAGGIYTQGAAVL